LSINSLIKLIKKKGIRDTFYILSKYENYKTDIYIFYNELNRFSYYNSFLRVKDELINKGLIFLKKDKKKKYISLTEKGILIYNKLVEINEIIEEK